MRYVAQDLEKKWTCYWCGCARDTLACLHEEELSGKTIPYPGRVFSGNVVTSCSYQALRKLGYKYVGDPRDAYGAKIPCACVTKQGYILCPEDNESAALIFEGMTRAGPILIPYPVSS